MIVYSKNNYFNAYKMKQVLNLLLISLKVLHVNCLIVCG